MRGVMCTVDTRPGVRASLQGIYRRELHAVSGAVHEVVIAARKKAKFLKLKSEAMR